MYSTYNSLIFRKFISSESTACTKYFSAGARDKEVLNSTEPLVLLDRVLRKYDRRSTPTSSTGKGDLQLLVLTYLHLQSPQANEIYPFGGNTCIGDLHCTA